MNLFLTLFQHHPRDAFLYICVTINLTLRCAAHVLSDSDDSPDPTMLAYLLGKT